MLSACLETADQSMIFISGDIVTAALPTELYVSTFNVALCAIASMLLIAFGKRLSSLRAHPSLFYCAASASGVGLLAIWLQSPPALVTILYVVFLLGIIVMLFYWLELALSVNAFELILAIIGSVALTIATTALVDILALPEFFCVFALALSFLCFKHLDGRLDPIEPGCKPPKPTANLRIISNTVIGLCFVGFAVGIETGAHIADRRGWPISAAPLKNTRSHGAYNS